MNTSTETLSPLSLRHKRGERSTAADPSSAVSTAPRASIIESPAIVAVTGTNGKTTVTRMVAHMAQYMGVSVGMATTDGIYIGDRCIARGETTGYRSAQTVLADPTVALAVLETAPGGIVRRGLGYEQSDAAVLTNAHADHLGQDAIEDIGDLVRIQSLVAERVREGGALIISADDPRLLAVIDCPRVRRLPRSIVYYSLDASCSTVQRHRSAGGRTYVLREEWLIEANGADEKRVARVADVPVTLEGAARFQIANALAAIAAARAVGLGLAEIACGLRTFESTTHNLGRGGLYRVRRGYVLLDYAHNPAAIAALCDMVGAWPARRITGVLSAPGNRCDGMIERSGKTAARGFDRLFLKDDKDLRRREQGEVPEILRDAILEEIPGYPCSIIFDEEEAVIRAIEEMETDEVVVVISDSPERMKGILDRYNAAPARTFLRQERPIDDENLPAPSPLGVEIAPDCAS